MGPINLGRGSQLMYACAEQAEHIARAPYQILSRSNSKFLSDSDSEPVFFFAMIPS